LLIEVDLLGEFLALLRCEFVFHAKKSSRLL
jgi:hypothetical protein